MAEPDRIPHPACSRRSEHGAAISTPKTKPNVELDGTSCPENPLLTPALLGCLIFQPNQAESTLISLTRRKMPPLIF